MSVEGRVSRGRPLINRRSTPHFPSTLITSFYFILIVSPLGPSWSLAPVEVERM